MAATTRRTSRSVDVNLSTAETVQSLLEDAGVPVSRNWLLEHLRSQGHATSRKRLNRALEHYFALGLVIEGSKGVQWTHNMSPELLRALATGKRL